jgi:hypothetical protein
VNHFNKLLITLSVALVSSTVPASAATMYFNPDQAQTAVNATGAIDVVLPLDKMGTLPVPRGRIKINGNAAELTMIPEWQFDRDQVLAGSVLDTKIDTTGKQPIVRGVLIWTDGSWIDYFDDHKPDETVVSNGASITGRITEVTPTDIAIESGGKVQRAPLTAISEIQSPRVFSFAIPTTPLQRRVADQPFYSDARSISMEATAKPFRLAALKRTIARQMDDGDWSTAKIVGVGTILSLVELSQLVPTFAVPLGVGPNYSHQLRVRSFQVLNRGF